MASSGPAVPEEIAETRWSGLDAYLLDQVQVAVIATDLAGRVTHWNRQAEVLYGWTLSEALGHDIRDLLVDASDLALATQLIDRVTGGRPWEGEFPIRRKDGTQALCHVTLSPIHDGDRRVIGAVSVSVDVMERRLAEQRLRAQHGVTRVLAEAASLSEATPRILRAVCESLRWDIGAIWSVDKGAGVIRCVDVWHRQGVNASQFEELTRRAELAPGVGLPGRVWEARRSAWIRDVVEDANFPRGPAAAAEGIHGAFGFPIRLGGQVLAVLEFFSFEIREQDDELLRAMAVIGSQIGQFMERKQAEEAVARSEAIKSAILEAALDCVITMDHEGRIVEFNPAAERTFGRRRADVIGERMAELIIPPHLRDEHRRGFARYLATGKGKVLGKRIELTGMRSDGSEFPVELTIARVDTLGPPLFSGYVRDITERKRAEEDLRASRDQLEAIFQGASEGISVQDAAGRIIYANEAAADVLGFPSVEALLATPVPEIMRGFQLLDEDGGDFPVEQLPGRVALQKGEASERVMRFRIVATGEERWSWVRANPVRDDQGQVQFAVNVFHDISDERRAQRDQAFLAEASRLLAESLNWEETLRRVAELAVPTIADWCIVWMRQDDGSIVHLRIHHADPARARYADDYLKRYPPDPQQPRGAPAVIRSGRSALNTEISDESLVALARDKAQLAMLRNLDLMSSMIVPLVARNRILGAITFVSSESGRHYGPQDLALAEDLALRAGLAVDNARLYREQADVAEALQRSLLPPDVPEIPGVDVAARYRPAGHGTSVGGDFYDVFPMESGGWALVIGDVCGKGPEAAGLTGLARHTMRAAAMQHRKPSLILARLNDAVLQQRSDNTFCTVCFVRLRLGEAGARLTVSCGGHPAPLILRADGSVESAGTPGTLLGIFADPDLGDRAYDLRPGDAVVLYTDGVIEEHSGAAVFDRERLASLLGSCAGLDAAGIVDAIEGAILGFRPDPPRDDIAILVAKVGP